MDLTKAMTRHALHRSRTRCIPTAAIEAVVTYGRCRRTRGAEVFTLGWRERRYWAEQGVDLSSFEGIQVVCTLAGQVLTVYRNHKPAALRDRLERRAA